MFVSVYTGLKRCPSLLDITDIQVFPRNFRYSSLFSVTCKNCPSPGCVSAANRVCKNVDIFRKPITSFKQICEFYINLYMTFFSWFMAFAPTIFHIAFSHHTAFVLFAYCFVYVYLYCFFLSCVVSWLYKRQLCC